MTWLNLIAAVLGFVLVFIMRDTPAAYLWAGIGIFQTVLRGVEAWLGSRGRAGK